MRRSTPRIFRRWLGIGIAATLISGVLVLAGVQTAHAGINVWTSHGPPGGVFTPGVTTVAIDPLAPTTLYAGTDIFGVIKSTDGGTVWTGASPGVGISALAIAPLAPSTLYANGGVLKSTDAGASWDFTGLSNSAGVLAVDP